MWIGNIKNNYLANNMTTDEKQLARWKFQLKIYQSDGIIFQNLATKILQKSDPEFRLVKPHGKAGDKKNDGFIPSKGRYYQMYAPENLSQNVTAALNKCRKDFAGLKLFWESASSPIKEFYFVVNDKYKGSYPKIEKGLLELTEAEKLPCRSFCANDLENLLFELNDQDIIEIIEFLPDVEAIESLDYSILNEVVGHLLQNQQPYSVTERYIAPDYFKKIKFNNLDHQVATLLTSGAYQTSVLEEYFTKSSSFLKQDVRDRFSSLYKKFKKELNRVPNESNLIFFAILDGASPKRSKPYQDAVLILMSYYFEACDIFEEPK